MARSVRRAGRAAAALLLAAVLAGCGAEDRGTLSILVPWTSDEEFGHFAEIIKGFQRSGEGRGVRVLPNRTRATRQVLEASIHNRRPPNLAIVPSPGVLRDYAGEGLVRPLDGLGGGGGLAREVGRRYGAAWLGFERAGTAELYGIAVKANVKSLVWYNGAALGAAAPGWKPPGTWRDLLALQDRIVGARGTPWCMAMSDPPNSGWPGTDWIEDILLHQAGPEEYARFARGTLPWRSERVRGAWRAWGEIVGGAGHIRGGRLGAMLTAYGRRDDPMFAAAPGCHLGHGATISTSRPGAGGGGFFPFPAFSSPPPAGGPAAGGAPSVVSADLMAMFRDSPQARAFIRYLVGAEAQGMWPAAAKGVAFSPHLSVLDDQIRRGGGDAAARIARLLVSGAPLCFDASDWMPDAMANAFYRATLEYLDSPTSARLEEILRQLDTVRTEAKAPVPDDTACGTAPTQKG
ncbi:extracellular solute-binding protein [Actinomadura yumaensis]|uniref:Extracellular solute-binding protein n=1 Tax=Actinomadura yumaensis TaxID=111807 RepID=A0ABW2CS61_9ACTN